MKTALFAFAFLLPSFSRAQASQQAAQVMMDKFVRYYNMDQPDSICTLLTPMNDSDCFWKWAERDGKPAIRQYGRIKSYTYLGTDDTDPSRVSVFKVVYTRKGTKALSFTLEPNGRFGTFWFDTRSDEIKKMLYSERHQALEWKM